MGCGSGKRFGSSLGQNPCLQECFYFLRTLSQLQTLPHSVLYLSVMWLRETLHELLKPSTNSFFWQGYGIAKYPDTKVTPSTLFGAGSTTKAFTAAAISFLIDNSSFYSDIKWDTPVSSILRDDFVLENDFVTTHATVEDILSHRTGMPRHDFSYGLVFLCLLRLLET